MTTQAAAPSDTKQLAPFHARAFTLSLTAKDLAKSVAWYTDIIGFTVDQRHERDGVLRAVSLRAGDVRMLLNQDDGGRGWERVKGEGFAFMFVTPDVDAAAQRIRDAGGTLATEPADMPWGARMFRMADPDGFRFSIST